MKLHIILYILGTLILLLAWLLQQRYNDQQARHAQTDARKTEDRVVARVIETTSPEGQIEAIREELRQRGSRSASSTYDPQAIFPPNIDEKIQAAIRQLPAEVRAMQRDDLNALLEESYAQRLAEEIDTEFRPRLSEIINLIHDVVLKASDADLIKLQDRPTKLTLPVQIAYTTFAMTQNSISEEQASNAMTFHFRGGGEWLVYLKVGMVQSPKTLAIGWDAPTNKYYPMLRLKEKNRGKERILATIWYHQDSKDLRFELNARHEVRPSTRSAIEELERTRQGNDLVASALVELIKHLRLALTASK